MSSNKKSSVHRVKFELVPRSQRDPLLLDGDAPPVILIPKRKSDAKALSQIDPSLLPSEKQEKRGVFEKAYQNDGLILDHEVFEAMSKDFDYNDPNNIIDDDFFEQAGGLMEEDNVDDDDDAEEFRKFIQFNADNDVELEGFEDEVNDELTRLSKASRSKAKSFSRASMTSSAIRRSRGLQQIDEHFENLFEREYADEDGIGPLNDNEIKGDDLLNDMKRLKELKQDVKEVRNRNFTEYVPELTNTDLKEAIIGSDSEFEDDEESEDFEERKSKIDCESMVDELDCSNRPKLITEPRKRKSTSQSFSSTMNQMDVEMEDDNMYGKHSNSKAMSVASSRASIISRLSVRPQNETIEDKRARKRAIKEYRRLRREERKTNQMIFKAEQNNLLKQKRCNQAAIKL